MSEKRKGVGGRPAGIKYPRRLMVYETDEGIELLNAIAHRLGTTQAGAIRQLVREKAREWGLTDGGSE